MMETNEGNNTMASWLIGVLTATMFVLTFIFGWIVSSNVVAHECNKLGAFYVGSTVYECRVKK